MDAEKYTGRLVADGEKHLRAYEATVVGEQQVKVYDENGSPVLGSDGKQITVPLPEFEFGPNHWRPVAHDPENSRYIFIDEDDPSHNDRHEKNVVVVNGTSGPLYEERNGQMVKVSDGDAHHEGPLPDDAHYDPTAPNNIRALTDPDDVAVTITGHTEAYGG